MWTRIRNRQNFRKNSLIFDLIIALQCRFAFTIKFDNCDRVLLLVKHNYNYKY